MFMGPDMRKGELCACSVARASSGGRLKSEAIVGKSRAMFAGSSEGLEDDRDRRYSLPPAEAAARKSPKGFLMYWKFFCRKSI